MGVAVLRAKTVDFEDTKLKEIETGGPNSFNCQIKEDCLMWKRKSIPEPADKAKIVKHDWCVGLTGY